jgi:hypothetical protein
LSESKFVFTRQRWHSNGSSVGNIAHAYFCAEFFNMPLKGNPHSSADAYAVKELSDALFALFGYVFLDLDPAQSYKNRVIATRETERMGEVMTKAVSEASGYRLTSIFGRDSNSSLAGFGRKLVQRLREGGNSVEEAVWSIIPTAAAACATQAQGVRLDNGCMDLYTNPVIVGAND